MVKRVLITGMSGVGKSSLLDELAARGYRTVDTDYGDYHETVDGEWLWREDRIDALLSEEGTGLLFVQGTTRNQVQFFCFDHIVLLSARRRSWSSDLPDAPTIPIAKTRTMSPRHSSTWKPWSRCSGNRRRWKWGRPCRSHRSRISFSPMCVRRAVS